MAPPAAIVVELDHVEDLFTTGGFAPLKGHFEPRSGMEQVLDQVAVRRPRRHDKVLVRLLIASPTQVTDAEIKAAIRGYCGAVIADRQLDVQRVRQSGRNALILGVGFLAVCLLLSTGITAATMLPEFIRRLFGEGLIIAGWVGLWRPVELVLFDTRPPQHEIRLHRAIAGAEIEIQRTA